MNTPIRAAIVGFGSVAEKMHAPLIDVCDSLILTAAVERNSIKCQEKYLGVQTFRSLEALLEADSVDLVIITTPNEFHFPMAKACLLAGKHVVVDKPVTIFSHEAEKLGRIAQERNLILSVFHNRRFDGDVLTIQKLISENTLGEIVYLESHFDRFRPDIAENWREKDVPGNGITFDLGVHLIDQIVLFFGLPNWIQADIRKQRTGAIADDHFDIQLDFGSIKARATAGVLSASPTPRFLVQGKKGSYLKFGLDVQEAKFKAGQIPEGEDWGVENPEKWGRVFYSESEESYPTENGDYRIFYQNIAKAILGEESLLVSIPQTISVLKIIEAAFESAAQGRRISRVEGGW
ncbi:MAG: scyllo-inositol 2-dehydrogenase (NADP+) [Algoriphagus sp.]|jgi:scyllo-inositol 2-dehydrogenase (NADP+)|tara:strand:- start:403 stop:1449 length:1047 start_codon:yes stop_codon:yes gene_type:complete